MIIRRRNCILLSVNGWMTWNTRRMTSCRLVKLMSEDVVILTIGENGVGGFQLKKLVRLVMLIRMTRRYHSCVHTSLATGIRVW